MWGRDPKMVRDQKKFRNDWTKTSANPGYQTWYLLDVSLIMATALQLAQANSPAIVIDPK